MELPNGTMATVAVGLELRYDIDHRTGNGRLLFTFQHMTINDGVEMGETIALCPPSGNLRDVSKLPAWMEGILQEGIAAQDEVKALLEAAREEIVSTYTTCQTCGEKIYGDLVEVGYCLPHKPDDA